MDALSALIAVTSCHVLADHFLPPPLFSLSLSLSLLLRLVRYFLSFFLLLLLLLLLHEMIFFSSNSAEPLCDSHNGSDGARKQGEIRLHHGVSVFYPRVSVGIVKSCFCGSVRDQQLLPCLAGEEVS